MSTITQPITATDLLRIPDDGRRYELIKGELKVHEPAGHVHGRIATKIAIALGNYVVAHKLGEIYAAETGFLISQNPDTVRAPDVAFVTRQRAEQIGDSRGYFPGAPDLAIEVISPGDAYTEVEDKALSWLEAGSRMVLTLDPRLRIITVYRSYDDIAILTEAMMVDGGDVVPGWSVRVGELF